MKHTVHLNPVVLLRVVFPFLPFLGALPIDTRTRAWLSASHSHTVVRASGFRLGISAFPRYTRAVFLISIAYAPSAFFLSDGRTLAKFART